jgi:hypothetical protein
MRLDICLLLPDTALAYLLARICEVQTRREETVMQQRKMNKSAFSFLALCVSSLAVLLTNAASQNNQTNNKVKVLSPGIEVAEVLTTADQCGSKKGQTIRLKVTSPSALGVRLYVKTGHKRWMPKDFPNQQAGSEITDYRCDQKPDYKVYAHAAGSSDAWPKP